MRTHFVYSMVSLCVIFSATSSSADVSVSVKHKYYDVEGLNAMGIWNKIRRNSIARYNGTTYSGSAAYTINAKYWWNRENGKCSMKKVLCLVDVTIILPNWTNYRTASREWQQSWDRFYTALEEHENKHKDITVRAAQEIEGAIMQLGERDSCAQLKAEADKIYSESSEKLRRTQVKFDEDTDHGVTEGVVLKRD